MLQKIIFHSILLLIFPIAIHAQDSIDLSITPNDANRVREKLAAYDKGKLGMEDLNEKAGQSGSRALIGFYLKYPDEVSAKAKLPISRSYAEFGMWPNALSLATDYVRAYSNDWHGWRVVGAASCAMNLTNQAMSAYSNAIRLGDRRSNLDLAGAGLQFGDMDVIKPLIPALLKLRDVKETAKGDRAETMGLLIVYSVKVNDEDAFIKALEGVAPAELMENADLRKDFELGCQFFYRSRKATKLCGKLNAKIEEWKKANPQKSE